MDGRTVGLDDGFAPGAHDRSRDFVERNRAAEGICESRRPAGGPGESAHLGHDILGAVEQDRAVLQEGRAATYLRGADHLAVSDQYLPADGGGETPGGTVGQPDCRTVSRQLRVRS